MLRVGRRIWWAPGSYSSRATYVIGSGANQEWSGYWLILPRRLNSWTPNHSTRMVTISAGTLVEVGRWKRRWRWMEWNEWKTAYEELTETNKDTHALHSYLLLVVLTESRKPHRQHLLLSL